MYAPTEGRETACFGSYEVDFRSGELRKFGVRVKVGEQPLRILMLLIERSGELVTREELQALLWSDDTFVNFEHSTNSAMQRLRDILSDTAQKAEWIETVPRRGYRFVGRVQWVGEAKTTSVGEPSDARAEHNSKNPSSAPVRTRHRRTTGIFVLSMVCVLLLAGAILKVASHGRTQRPAISVRSLAILPLENVSGDPSQEYFADGMTDELTTALAKNRSLRVVSRTSAMQFRGANHPIAEIARLLRVDAILEGSVSRSGNRVHLIVQLIHAKTDTHIWAESYDREFGESFSLPAELSYTVAKEIKVAISPPKAHRSINPEAHDAYLRGRYFWFSDNDEPSLGYFQKAIQLQPDYAAAWSGLADYYAGHSVKGYGLPREFEKDWELDAHKAVDLDDSLAEAHNSLAAWYFFSAWDWQHAESEVLRAIALNSNYAEAFHLYCYVLIATGRSKEAIEAQKHAMEIDPFARPWALGSAYYYARQYEDATNELRLREEAEPGDGGVHSILADVYHLRGLDKDSVDEWRQFYFVHREEESAQAIADAFARGGYTRAADWMFERRKAQARRAYLGPYWLALDSARAGNKEETLHFLEQAYRDHSPRLVFVQAEPAFDSVRKEERYRNLIKKVGLGVASN